MGTRRTEYEFTGQHKTIRDLREPYLPNEQDRLTHFLYILLRDTVPFGEVERIMRDHVEVANASDYGVEFSEPHIEKYSRAVAVRILMNTPRVHVDRHKFEGKPYEPVPKTPVEALLASDGMDEPVCFECSNGHCTGVRHSIAGYAGVCGCKNCQEEYKINE